MKVWEKTGFVYDLKRFLDSGLVAHGFGSRIKARSKKLAMKAAHFAAL
jgi:hypothetical protein